MTNQTALEALRDLGERASLRPWQHDRGPDTGDVVCREVEPDSHEIIAAMIQQPRAANAAYAALAVNSIDAAVAALEKTGHRPYRENTTHWHEDGEQGFCPGCAFLAAIRKAAQEAK